MIYLDKLKTMSNAKTFFQPTESISFKVTPEIAANWLANHNYEHQRNIRAYHVQALARTMEAGQFREKTQINFMRLGDSFHLTNGQHTLSAIEKSGIAQNLCVIVSVARCMNDVADDFSRHDTHLTRQLSDALSAHEVDKELGVTKTQLQWISAASLYLRFLKGEVTFKGNTHSTHDEKIETIRKYGIIGKEALSFFEGHTNKSYLTRKTTLAIAMLCHEASNHAGEFWAAIAMDDGLKANDPRKVLLEWLKSRVTTGGAYGMSTLSKKTTTDPDFIKGIASAWNAWIESRELKIIRTDHDASTVVFKGVGELTVKRQTANFKKITQNSSFSRSNDQSLGGAA